MQGLGPQQQNWRIRLFYPGQVFQGFLALFLFGGNTGQLQIGIGMERINLEQFFEIGLGLGCLATDEIVVPGIVEESRGWGALRQSRKIVSFRFVALSFCIQPCRVTQRLGLNIQEKGEHQPAQQDGPAVHLEHINTSHPPQRAMEALSPGAIKSATRFLRRIRRVQPSRNQKASPQRREVRGE